MTRETALVVTTVLALAGSAEAVSLLGVGPWGVGIPSNLYSIDAANGSTTLIGSTGVDRLGGLAVSPSGILYGYNAFNLYTINLSTAEATLVGPLGFVHPEGGLSFQPGTRTLFGLASAFRNDRLVNIDTLTGASSVVATMAADARDPSGLAFRGDGTLFGAVLGGVTSSNGRLITIDPSTGSVNLVGLLGPKPGLAAIAALTFAGNTLYYSDGFSLYSVNQFTGSASLIGGIANVGGAIGGLAHVPEPNTAVLFGIGLVAIARRRHQVRPCGR